MSRAVFAGRTASAGTAVGLIHRADLPPPTELRLDRIGTPAVQITVAFETVSARLLTSSEKLRADGRFDQADILEVISCLAADTDLRARAVKNAQDGMPVALAVQRAVKHHADALAALPDPTLAERAADVRQIGNRAIAYLHGQDRTVDTDHPLVLVATEIGAADLLEPTITVAAAASVIGGPNSHAAIVARSLGVPLLVGIDITAFDQADGRPAIVDGERGTLTVDPSREEHAAAQASVWAARRLREALAAERHLPARTLDDRPVTLRANAATLIETRTALDANADGVGLLRTELPFLDATEWPSEVEHAAVLGPILRALAGRPATVRTLDYADDKLPPFLAQGRTGGGLGRGLPLMLAEPDAFARQFRAICSAGSNCDLHIMIPMVASVDELHACRRILDGVARELGTASPRLGVMIELPEAIAAVEDFAIHADFLSIGTNDLTGQILGLDRRDPELSPGLAAHPAVLRAIADTITMAHLHHRQVSVCGDAAAHPLVLPLLVGLGCDILSVAPASLDRVRFTVRRLNHAHCATVAGEALGTKTIEEVWEAARRLSPALP